MSLINQVLQDLEKRHASEPELQSLPPHVRAVAGAPSAFPLAKVVAAVVIIAGVIVGAFYFGGWMRTSAQPGIAAAPSGPTALAPAPVVVVPSKAPEPEPVVKEMLLAPASKLSDELSFVPDAASRKSPAVRSEKPMPARPQTQPPAPVAIPDQFRAAIESPRPPAVAATPAPPPAPAAPVPQDPPAAPSAAKPPVADTPAVQPAAKPPVADTPPVIDKQMREMTPPQRAETAFRTGVAQLRDARAAAAEASFREALREDQNHVAARQALLGLLLDARRNDEAEQLLRTALTLNPRQPRHAMVLARLQVDRGEVPGAINTLVGALPYVQSDPEYYAFLAALLQREGRHKETIDYYRAALRSSPGNALWLMGLGISLRATSQFADARESFERAVETRQLKGELLLFTERQLKELGAPTRK